MPTLKVTHRYLKDIFSKQWPVLEYCKVMVKKENIDPSTRLEVYGEHDEPDLIVPHMGKYVKNGPKIRKVAI